MKESRQHGAGTAKIDSVPRLIGRIALITLTVLILWVIAKNCAVPPRSRDGRETNDQGGNGSTEGVRDVPQAPPKVESVAGGDS